ncbi:hypothetical protein KJ934_00770 [Patescibacteria group bacterium]|nr:hypothetical protein [Patescibacteria group bacterium]MBU4353544.1 hypothetical protein [Patescibacteria group bacterium]MBU4476841.1 hypothetical protein [Patescibacteria group bacterium]MCG2699285.1 hypothetical protein [Candidatus Parcubacteria bacterium]
MERRIQILNGKEGSKIKVDFLTDPEKKKIKKLFKGRAKIYPGRRGVFLIPTGSGIVQSLALDLGEELKAPLVVPEGISFAECFATRHWPAVPALP